METGLQRRGELTKKPRSSRTLLLDSMSSVSKSDFFSTQIRAVEGNGPYPQIPLNSSIRASLGPGSTRVMTAFFGNIAGVAKITDGEDLTAVKIGLMT